MSVKNVDQQETGAELQAELGKCLESGNFLVAFVRREKKELLLRRFTQNFSITDFEPAMKLLQNNLQEERDRLIREDEE